jgi:hypothetical protein
MVNLTFEETIEIIMSRHKTSMGGTEMWIDWDAIYSDLIDEGFDPAEASIMLDEYMEKNGY